jgi:hypothetical protein
MGHDTRPDPVLAPAPSRPHHTRDFLIAFYSLAVVWGVRSLWSRQPSNVDGLMPLALSLSLGWWAIADARTRHKPIPLLAQQSFVLFAGFLVPGYILSSRRWRGLMWMLLGAFGWYVLASVVMYAFYAVLWNRS